MSAYAPRSLGRVLHLFDAIARSRNGLSLAEISEELESPKSSLLNLLKPLVEQDYLIRDHSRYSLGPAAFRLASTILSGRQLTTVLRPFLNELLLGSKETVFLTTLDRKTRLVNYIDAIDSPQVVRYSVPIGSVRPIYATAAGRVLLAFADKDWREEYLKTEKLKRFTANTPVSRSGLRRKLADIRKIGFEVSLGDMIDDVGGLAAPVKNADGSVSAAFLIAGPVARFERELQKNKKLILEIADKASGWNGDDFGDNTAIT